MYFMIQNNFPTQFFKIIILSICMLSVVEVQADTYNSENGELFLPNLVNGSKALTDVIIKLSPIGTYTIESGIESPLPVICPGSFTEATLDLVKSASNLDEVNSLLGCHWQNQQISTQSISGNSSLSKGASWQDSTCSSLTVSILSDDSGNSNISVSGLNQSPCNIAPTPSDVRDLNDKFYSSGFVLVDDSHIALDVLIKFHSNNQYELISYALIPQGSPQKICNSLTEENYNKISIGMTPDEVGSLLGCQWSQKPMLDNDSSGSYLWTDHECNYINFAKGTIKVLAQFKFGGCSGFLAK